MDASLIQQGALGILALAAMTVAAVLWRRLDDERKKRDEDGKASVTKVEALMTAHRTEMMALLERIIEDAKTTTNEYHTLADRSTEAMETLARRFDRAPTRRG